MATTVAVVVIFMVMGVAVVAALTYLANESKNGKR